MDVLCNPIPAARRVMRERSGQSSDSGVRGAVEQMVLGRHRAQFLAIRLTFFTC